MKSKHIQTILLASLAALPVVYAAAVAGSSDPPTSSGARMFVIGLSLAVLLIEVLVLAQVVRVRALFSSADAARFTWTLIACFLFVRIFSDIRLIVGFLNLFPTGPFNLVYFFTLSDLLFVASLATAIRLYKSTGLKFEIKPIDYFYIAGAWAITAATVLAAYYQGRATDFSSVTGYRVVAVTVGGVILSLGLVVRRYVSQMGGGAVARVWNCVVIASVARDASHLASVLLPIWFPRYSFFVDTYLLWIFAWCWALAASLQQEIIPRARATKEHAALA
ncbi:MAG: hypothetical protein AB1631_13035 [Acidobacteriota bacterium]